MAVRPRGGTFQVDFTVAGKRVRQDGFGVEAQAAKWEIDARQAVLDGRELPPVDQSHKGTTWGELFDRVAAAPAPRGWAGSKAEDTALTNGRFIRDHFGPAKEVAKTTTEDFDGLIAAMMGEGKSNGTINRKLAAASKMIRFGVKRGWLTQAPTIELLKEGQGRIRFLTEDEEKLWLQTLRAWAMDDVVDLFEFLIDTGARLGEVIGWKRDARTKAVAGARLGWQDVDANRITFWDTKNNGQPRTVFMTARGQAVLARRKARGLATPFGDLDKAKLRSAWERCRNHLSMPDVVIHTLRHTCASRLVQRGADLRRVQIWMGHSSITTTLRYAHLAPTDLMACATLLEPPKPVTRDVTDRDAA